MTEDEEVAEALYDRAKGLVARRRYDEALAAHQEIEQRYHGTWEPALRVTTVRALGATVGVLGALGRLDEAIAARGEAERRAGGAVEPLMRTSVAVALCNEGMALRRGDRLDEAISAYDECVRRYRYDTGAEIQAVVAAALCGKGDVLGQLGRFEDAIAAFEEVRRRYGGSTDPAIRRQLALALGRRANVLGQLDASGRTGAEIAACDEVVPVFGGDDDPWSVNLVSRAICNKAVRLRNDGRSDEAVAAYDEFGGHPASAPPPGCASRRQEHDGGHDERQLARSCTTPARMSRSWKPPRTTSSP